MGDYQPGGEQSGIEPHHGLDPSDSQVRHSIEPRHGPDPSDSQVRHSIDPSGIELRRISEQFRASLETSRMLHWSGLFVPTPVYTTLLVWAGVHPVLIVGWIAQYVMVLVAQLIHVRVAMRSIGTARMEHHIRVSDWFRLAMGFSVGSLAVLTQHGTNRDPVDWMFTLLVLSAVMCTNVMDGYGRRIPFIAYSVPIAGLGMAGSWWLEGRIGMLLPLLCPVFLGMLISVNWQVGAMTAKAIQLRFELEDVNGALITRAATDELTGLANRMALKEQLDQRRGLSEQTAVLFLDLDGFKEINDVHGHEIGDLVLTVVAERIVKSLRPSDTAIRLGGDEFLVLLGGADERMADAVSHRVRRVVCEPIPVGNGVSVSVATSIGAALAGSDRTIEEAISDADHRMYVAKALSRRQRMADRNLIHLTR
jgi:diguanylate cyclase (GGDEF)-like protein